MSVVRVRYFAGAAAAAGLAEEQVEMPGASTVAQLRAELSGRHPALVPVLEVASLLVDGVTTRDGSRVLPADPAVDVLPPFAGG